MTSASGTKQSDLVERIRWITRLRWVAVAGFTLAVFLANLALPSRFVVLLWAPLVAAAYNGLVELYLRLYHRRGQPLIGAGEPGAVLHLLLGLDMIVAAVVVHLTGGIESPLLPFYLLIVPVSALIVPPRTAYIHTSLALVLVGSVFGLEYAGLLPHRLGSGDPSSPLNMASPGPLTRFSDKLLEETVTLVAEAFGYYNVAIFLVDETAGDLVRWAEAGKRDVPRPEKYRQRLSEDLIGWVAQTGQPLLSNDVRQEPRYVKAYLPDTRSELDVPLKYGDQILGVLNVESTELNAFGQEDVVTLQILADQVAVAIENARLCARQEEAEQTLRRRAEELSVLHQTALAGTQATDADALIVEITRLLATNLYQENVGFLLLDPERGALHPHPSYHGVTPAMRELVIPLGTGITGTVARTGEPLLVPDVRQDERYLEASPTVRSELCVPLRVEGQVVGVINVESPQLNGFSQDDLHLLSTVAEHVGIALEKLRLFEETRRRNEELAARNAIAHAVSHSLEVEDVLEQLYQEVNRLLAPDTFFVALYNEEDGTFDVGLVIEHGERLPRFSAGLDETGGLTAWVIRECRPLLVRDLLTEVDNLPARPQHVGEPARSWLGVPLVARGRVVGVLSVQSFEPNAFDTTDEQFLSAVADQVAMAVDNARLYEKTRHMAFTDGLTGLYNSRHFYRVLEKELARSTRYQHPVSLIMLDLDDFKKYNDRYGHLAGDDLLKELARVMRETVRKTDVVARYGGGGVCHHPAGDHSRRRHPAGRALAGCGRATRVRGTK